MFKNKPWIQSVALIIVTGLWLAGCTSAPPKPAPAEKPPAPAPTPAKPAMEPAKPVPAQIVKPDYPQRYVVVKGDTLWDIAARFLKDPWLWPEVWQINPEIKNPHLIYPGDVITLYYDEHGKPVLRVERGGKPTTARPTAKETPPPKGIKTVKLKPRVRVEPLERAISTIPMDVIGPFLSRPRVVTEKELENAPYVVSSYEEHLATATGDRIYVRGLQQPVQGTYEIVRPGQAYRDAETGEILGYEAQHLADARLIRTGDPATLDITKARLETLDGDRLLPVEQRETTFNYLPRAPKQKVNGHIIAVINGVSQIGQYAVVVLDRGEQAGLAPGNVMAIFQKGPIVRDQVVGGDETVKLPDERAGELMVFRVFDRVSYALVMRALRPLHVDDRVTNP
ncbi:MAG TPA: LysM domain-containing protein [Gammaproteobacteria bacterium]|nr:LysM domain-containing protein [Gammaproteobacteria bacterium]